MESRIGMKTESKVKGRVAQRLIPPEAEQSRPITALEIFLRVVVGLYVIIIAAIALQGCAPAATQHVIYKDVYVPQPCTVIMPAVPVYANNPAVDVVNILEYASALEIALTSCGVK